MARNNAPPSCRDVQPHSVCHIYFSYTIGLLQLLSHLFHNIEMENLPEKLNYEWVIDLPNRLYLLLKSGEWSDVSFALGTEPDFKVNYFFVIFLLNQRM